MVLRLALVWAPWRERGWVGGLAGLWAEVWARVWELGRALAWGGVLVKPMETAWERAK